MKLSLIKYYDKNWRVCLSDNFHKNLIKRLKGKGTRKNISSKLEVSFNTIRNFYCGLYNPTFGLVVKLSEIAEISQEKIIENIESVYSAGIGGKMKFIREIEIDSKFTEWFGAWLGDGDHSPRRECFSLTNYSINVLKLHLYILKEVFNFNEDQIKVEIIAKSNNFQRIKEN